MSEALPQVGTQLGPFRLITQLGEGGFAPVYLASEVYGGVEVRIVALKLFFAKQLGQVALHHVIAEARSLSKVEHRNVVRYLQIYEDVADTGIIALAMEHVRGESLGSRLEKVGVLSVQDTLAVGAAIASALAAVHAVGLIHRDVKPENVIEQAGGVYKLIDFGIAARAKRNKKTTLIAVGGAPISVSHLHSVESIGASAASDSFPFPSLPPSAFPFPFGGHGGASSSGVESAEPHEADVHQDRTLLISPKGTVQLPNAPGVTAQGGQPTMTVEDDDRIAGTMGYIDPACFARGALPDPSNDLYGLGAMLYELLSGRLPASPAVNSTHITQSIALGVERPPPLLSIAPHVPPEVAQLVDSLIEPDRTRRPRHAEVVAAEIDRLRRGVGRHRMLPEEGPFRGLASFDERHRDVFFGRSTELAMALEALRSRSLLALIGPSGSGKSSLARAGVLPALIDGELGGWPQKYSAVMMRPGLSPRAATDVAFAALFGPGLANVEPDTFVATLTARVDASQTGIVLYIDALEELVTTSIPTERAWLAEVIATITRAPNPGLRVVVTARRDFLDSLLEIPAFGQALARSVQLLAPLGSRVFADALEERLRVYGYSLEDRAMLDELTQELAKAPEAQPLFEFALARLWTERDQQTRRLSRAALSRIGGISGALEQHAEGVLRSLVAQHGVVAEPAMRHILLALTTARGTRRRRSLEEIMVEGARVNMDGRLVQTIAAALEQARLVIVEEGKLTLAHETLLARWPRLRTWVESVRRERDVAEETERAAARYEEKKQDRSLFLRGRALRDARDLAKSPAIQLSTSAASFVQASRKAETRGTTGVVVLVSSVLVGLVVLFGLYRVVEHDAREKQRQAEELTSTIKNTQKTSESERGKAIKALLEEKHACEKELEKRNACAPPPPTITAADDAGVPDSSN